MPMTVTNPLFLQVPEARDLLESARQCEQTMRNLRNGETREQAARAQAQASLEMARATHMKAQSLQDTIAQQLSGTNVAETSDPMTHENYVLHRG